jgi:AraC-like DNA-binding protein
VLYSRRSHAPALTGAEILLDRAIGERVVLRRVLIRGLIHDERLLAAPMRPDRSRLTVLLEGDLTAFVRDAPRPLGRGSFVASTRLGAVPMRGGTSLTLEIDWDPGGVAGTLAADVLEGMVSASTLDRLDALGDALATRPLSPAAVGAAFDALASEGLPFDSSALVPELTAADADDQRVMDALDTALCRIEQSPDTEDFVTALGCTRRTLTRRLRRLAELHRMYERAEDWRSERDFYRGLVAMLLLSHPEATTATVARMLGYRSAAALCHAFRRAGLPSPGRVRSALRA